ncbi:hypothetical protein [Caulobacter sp. RL271]|uniref:Uncharacterized protein n=1 Tax=Caulobacter segnis TaxID=88688 RepID=A0ABY4ZPX5_9CAUL|nr:hypothetical protein [Caulobacter segnis]USQ94756.1 hypothetical protein MZV50_19590 [Caulobacter segnis]
MKRMMTRVLMAATLCAAPLGMAQAQVQAQQAAPAQPYYTLDTKIADIFADPNARDVFGAFFRKRGEAAGQPEASPEEQANIAQVIKNFTPRQLATFPQANLDEEGLKTLGEALAKVPAPAATATPAPAAN